MEVGASVPIKELEGVIQKAEKAHLATKDNLWLLPWGLALWRQKLFVEALAVLDKGNDQILFNTDFQILRGMVARKLPDGYQIALASYRTGILLDPERSDSYYNFGNMLMDDEPEVAERIFNFSVQYDPQAAQSWHNLGITLNHQSRYEEALNVFRLSLRLDPMVADTWCNLGLAYFGLEDFESAESSFEHAISLDATHGASHINMGNVLISVLKPDQALTFLEKGVELESSSANSLWNLSLCYLLLGQYKQGWDYYESRFATKTFEDLIRPSLGAQPKNLLECPKIGEDEELLVWSEQGLGDAIQFSRYLNLLDALKINYKFMTRPALVKLFSQWFGLGERVIKQPNKTNKEDLRCQIPLLSLPKLFGTELSTIPSSTPYLKQPEGPIDESLLITPHPAGLSVGIVWASNPDNKAMYRNKSMPLELFMPRLIDLLDLELINLHCLQFGEDAKQLDPFRNHPRITDWSKTLKDFSETAHIINQLDLVISVDTAVAHLSGALNRPTWLLLPHNADFRWLKDRLDSPWYPTMRLFRQKEHGDWPGLINDLKTAMDNLFLLDIDGLSNAKLR